MGSLVEMYFRNCGRAIGLATMAASSLGCTNLLLRILIWEARKFDNAGRLVSQLVEAASCTGHQTSLLKIFVSTLKVGSNIERFK